MIVNMPTGPEIKVKCVDERQQLIQQLVQSTTSAETEQRRGRKQRLENKRNIPYDTLWQADTGTTTSPDYSRESELSLILKNNRLKIKLQERREALLLRNSRKFHVYPIFLTHM